MHYEDVLRDRKQYEQFADSVLRFVLSTTFIDANRVYFWSIAIPRVAFVKLRRERESSGITRVYRVSKSLGACSNLYVGVKHYKGRDNGY